MADAEARVVQALADVATIGMLQQRAIQRGDDLTEQLQGALNSRVIIEQAKGVLAQIHTTTPDAAFEMLRTYGRSNNRRLGEVASDVITHPERVAALTTAP